MELFARKILSKNGVLEVSLDKNITLVRRFGIGGDQISKNSSHLRGGKIGKWRDRFTEEESKIIHKRLDEFEISVHPLAYSA